MPGSSVPLWEPGPERAATTRMAEFIHANGFHDYADAYRWSISQPEQFWPALWDAVGIDGERGATVITPGQSMPTTRFFPDASLSVVRNMVRGPAGVAPAGGDHTAAVIAIDESGRRRSLTWSELRDHTAAMAGALHAAGVRPGDRVAGWLPNGIEVLVAMLGAASIGAVFSTASPDFGTQGVLDRFGQIEPTVLFATLGYRYAGKDFDCRERLDEIRANLPSVRACVVVGDDPPPGTQAWDQFLADGARRPVEPQVFPFDHPWYVLYSSGTTGVPKCIVHRTGGVLLQHMKEHQLHCDVRPGDRVFYYSTTGWMMWNWLVSALASGAAVVCYDGSPSHPSMDVLFDIVDAERVTMLGTSAKYIDTLRKAEVTPRATHDLSTLRTICSTGSPLSVEGYEYVYESVKHDVHVASISGGTELCATLLAGDPTSAVYAGEMQRPSLGMATDCVDDHGRSLAGSPGVPGELVCTRPFPSMPLGFWADGPGGATGTDRDSSSDGGEQGGDGLPDPAHPGPRYLRAYFERFPGVWTHGDFASWTEHGGMIIHGRSDATLNPGGVRIGTAEIYRVVEQLPAVVESLVFAQNWAGDVRIVLLVKTAPGVVLDGELRAELRARIRRACSPRHVPAVIAAVDDLPRTRSNKLVELAVADAVNGRPVRNTEALANPASIDAIVALPDLHR